MKRTKRRGLSRDEILDEAIKQIPNTWLDNLLTGNNWFKIPAYCPEIEKLLMAVKERIEALKNRGSGK